MGNWISNWLHEEQPPPLVLVPPLFDFPPFAARTRMLESSYNMLFGKLPLKCLFEDYFEEARHFSTIIMLKPIDDPHVDLIATIAGPVDNEKEENLIGNALFRWQSDVHDPLTFMDLFVSTSDLVSSEDYGVIGMRYGSGNISFGVTLLPFTLKDELPKSAWLVSKMGRLTFGVQYEPQCGSKDDIKYRNLKNWSCAIGYGAGSGSPLSPSFVFGLELAGNSQVNASFYQHVVVQRRVKNPFEEDKVVGITNYIDFGFELHTRVDDAQRNNILKSAFQIAASWQANKSLLLKAKAGPQSSSIVLALKSWWKPSFTFSISATRDRAVGALGYGFSIRIENLRKASYQRADPNFVMLAPNKEHEAEGIVWQKGNRSMLQSDLNAGNFDDIPQELRPYNKIL